MTNPFRQQNLEAIANYVRGAFNWKLNAQRDKDHNQPCKPFPECPWKVGDARDDNGEVIAGETAPAKNAAGEFQPATAPYFHLVSDGSIGYDPLPAPLLVDTRAFEHAVQLEIKSRQDAYSD